MALKAKDIALAGIASFVAWGYATHWFPALRFLGHGVVVGIVLTAGGLLALALLSVRGPLYGSPTSPSRRSVATAALRLTPAASRLPPSAAFTNPELWPKERAALLKRQEYHPLALYPDSPRVSNALDRLLTSAVNTFVRSWYTGISPRDRVFPNEIDGTIRLALTNLRDRLLAVDDVAEVLTSRLVPILTLHFHDFKEAERAVRGRKLNRSVTESDELDLAIAARYTPLHPAAQLSYSDTTTRLAQQDYLRKLTNRLLPALLPASFLASRPVAAIAREIVACAVLYPLMQILAEPDTWNQIMENYGRTMLQDRSTVRKLRAALDQHASPAVPRSGRPAPAFPRLVPGDSERRFERFVRVIRKVNNLSDARRFRSEVASQLKKDADSVYDGSNNTIQNNNSQEVQQTYLRRLEMGKRLLDQKVQYLAAGGDSRNRRLLQSGGGSSSSGAGGGTGGTGGDGAVPGGAGLGNGNSTGQTPTVSRLEAASLSELLRDAAGLSYFMEYMDRQRLLSLVQFWLVVDGFRNPLEEEDDDDDDDKDSGGGSKELPSTLPPWTESDRLDLAQIDQAYLSKPELHVSEASRRCVRAFLEAGRSATPEQYYLARRAILHSQAAVLDEMKAKHFQPFKKSDLFYKCLAAEEASQKNAAAQALAAAAHAAQTQSASHQHNYSNSNNSNLTSADNRSSVSIGRPPSLPPTNRKPMSAASGQPTTGPAPKSTAARLLPNKLHGKLRSSNRNGSVPDVRTMATTATTTTNVNAIANGSNGKTFDSLFAPPSPRSDIRRSLDERPGSNLFGDDDDLFSHPKGFSHGSKDNQDHDALADSVHSLEPEPQDQEGPDTKVVQAVEAALTNIMEDSRPTTAEDLRASLFGSDDGMGSSSIFQDNASTSSARGSLDLQRNAPLAKTKPDSTTEAKPEPKPHAAESHTHARNDLFGKSDAPARRDSGKIGPGKSDLDKPSLSSLGLVSAYSRIGVFEDDDLFGDDQAKYMSDDDDADDDDAGGGDGVDSNNPEKGLKEEDDVQAAAPGDLGLAEAITALTDDIDRLVAQEAVVDSLLKKAELTNNTAELRILKKSNASLQREIRRKELQRQQYVIQESDHSLYGKASVRLTTVQVGRDVHGKEYALYTIEVRRKGDSAESKTAESKTADVSGKKDAAGSSKTPSGEGGGTAAWAVSRRYSEFWALHQRLRARYPSSVRTLDFPRRHVVMKLQNDFLQKRRAALEKYLRALLLLPDVCRSRELRAFLSQRVILGSPGADPNDGNVISRLYDSVADGMEDFLGSIPVLDQLSVAGQNLIAAATSQLESVAPSTGAGGPPSTAAAAVGGGTVGAGSGGTARTAAPTSEGPAGPSSEAADLTLGLLDEEEEPTAPFVKPICDIFLEVFELNRGNNWLRGRAVVVVLHQLLGGTIERKLRENVKTLVQDESLLKYISMVQDALFPPPESPRAPRTDSQKTKTRNEAGLMLATLVPDLAGSVVGRYNAQAASRRIFATFNNQRLNAHLAFTLLDAIVDILFGEETK